MENERMQIKGLGVETAFVYDFASHGELFPVNTITDSKEMLEQDNLCFLLVKEQNYFEQILELKNGVVVCFDDNQSVTAVYRIASGVWQEQPDFTSVCAILAVNRLTEDSAEQSDHLAERVWKAFHKGDNVRFKYGINYIRLPELVKLICRKTDVAKPFMMMENQEYATVTKDEYELSGTVFQTDKSKKYSLLITNSDGRYETEEIHDIDTQEDHIKVKMSLHGGVNYITCSLLENGTEIQDTRSQHIVFRKQTVRKNKESIMWVEQYVNARTTNSIEKLEKLTELAQNAGITAFALDLKGVEGYCSYKKATRTNVKYMTCTTNPQKQITMEIDFLEEFIRVAHKKGIKVYGSFNFFVEGNLTSQDFAINLPQTHPEWAQVLYVPEDGGKLRSVLQTERNCVLCYVNPANKEVWEFEAKRVKEVLDNYQVDGIIMDRTRYDNQYADFSDTTKEQFIQYLTARGKKLAKWPEDIYTFNEEQSMVYGPLYLDWLAFRSGVIRDFAFYLKGIVEDYRNKQQRDIALAAYVGSWYDLYYQNGVNWGSKDFVYHEMLNFPLAELYSETYAQTSYLDAIDFIMIGCYYETAEMIEKYATIGNVVTNCQLPVIASLSLPHLKTKQSIRTAANACMDYSDGVMIFDLCYTDWENKVAGKQII